MTIDPDHGIWFNEPATEWVEALPLGNGLLGAMMFGRPTHELIALNDGTAWSGSPANETAEPQIDPAVAATSIREARAFIDRGDFASADESLKQLQHRYSQTFLPFGALSVRFGPDDSGAISDYRRRLDLRTATHEVTYCLADTRVVQTAFVSARNGVLIYTIQVDGDQGIDINIQLESDLLVLDRRTEAGSHSLRLKLPSDVSPRHDGFDDPVFYSADDSLSVQGAIVVSWSHDGVGVDSTDGLTAKGVRRATILVATQTTFAGLGKQPLGLADDAERAARVRIAAASQLGLAVLEEQHIADHKELYERTSAHFGDGPNIATNDRLTAANAHIDGPLAADPSLAALLFNFGRYLLISSSRPNGVPANLQGIWNDQLQPPWSSNYTTNINLQMNYWLAETTNLPECLPPLFDLIDALAITGAVTAKRLYHAPGWVAHHNTDVWAYSQPVGLGSHDPKWAFWPLASAWLVRHLWERVQHGAPIEFVRDRAFPPVRSAAEFFLTWLVEQSDGTLGTSPSTSPENQFRTPDGVIGSVAKTSAFDVVIIGDLFDILADIASRLGIDDDPVVLSAVRARRQLPDIIIDRDGMVQEWAEPFSFPDPHHRHVAHLYFVFPGNRNLTPELAAAASRSLDARGDESTGWALAWKLAMRARLREPAGVSRLLKLFFRNMDIDRGPWIGGLYTNLFSAHPPFQIDGNLGFVAGIAECVMQSHHGRIELLPAVPLELSVGSITGLVARPGVSVSLEWSANDDNLPVLVSATFRAASDAGVGRHIIRYGDSEIEIELGLGATAQVVLNDFAQDLVDPSAA